ncbi:hypothetical protein GCM10011344_03010 [Dokdonia pacifica]|uniref:Uncharacterized protein n=1 Tax=Dokdonia pacifica TaxID=1627892 RepID=A0A238ZF18_9FLAO|nr:hypothetical protein [Dokdonia pacifica]GGG05946.1 hypothetical protein GCM10011344_03010 [Dokdonia pacifica]SNR81692.1 hypothetical protein SAMN06265376_103161 [Dokdonia pacifica]
MGYILCEYHGGNVTAFISKYHANKANNQEVCVDTEVLKVQVVDKKELFNGAYIIDISLVNTLGIKDMKIDFQTDQKKFEALFDALEPVCSKCLEAYLNED